MSNEYGHSSFYVQVVHVIHYSIFPSSIKCLLDIKENRDDAVTSDKAVTYKCLKRDKLVRNIPDMLVSTLIFRYSIIFFLKPCQTLLTILSIVLHIQLVSEMEWLLVRFVTSLLIVSPHEFGNLSEYHVIIDGR